MGRSMTELPGKITAKIIRGEKTIFHRRNEPREETGATITT
jgi:hypothetical protein